MKMNRKFSLGSFFLAFAGLALALFLGGCGDPKHPSSMVGVWQSGQDGFFSAKVVLELKKSGEGVIHTSVMGAGAGNKFSWEVRDKKLVFIGIGRKGDDESVAILGQTDKTLVLSSSGGGTTTYTRVGE